MWAFALRRLAWAIPTLVLALVLTFLLTRITPGDPVIDRLSKSEAESVLEITDDLYATTARQMGLDKPIFYFSVLPCNHPSEIATAPPLFRPLYQFWADRSKNCTEARGYIEAFKQLRRDPAQAAQLNSILARWMQNEYSNRPDFGGLSAQNKDFVDRIYALSSRNKSLALYVPSFRWWGANNQFHDWISGALRLDFGKSLDSNEAASTRLLDALRWTIVVNLASILIAYLLAIPLGMYRAQYRNTLFDRASGMVLNLLYAIPVFWLGSMLVVFFSTSEYGAWTNIFPSVGIWESAPGDTFGQMMARNSGRLLIPIITLSTSLMAYISQQMRASALEELSKEYVLQLNAKGLTQGRILWRHVFRNASFPLITMLAGVLPATIGGALVMEVICNIPGMGRLMYDSVFSHDWNLVMLVVLAGSFITVLGILLSDLAYAWANPRINLSER